MPGLNSLKIQGPIDTVGAEFIGLSSIFLVTSVDLLSQYCLNFALGRMPPAPAPPRPAIAGQKTLSNVMVMVFASYLMPEIESVLPVS